MKVLILGAGTVGANIARYLATENNDVTVVDYNSMVLRRLSDTVDIQPVHGFASHPDVLAHAGAGDADLMIAVTGSDEVNIVACEVTNNLSGSPMKIARLRHQSYHHEKLKAMFGSNKIAIDHVISPEVAVAESIGQSLRLMGALDVKLLNDVGVKVIGIRCQQPSLMLNTPLRQLPAQFPRFSFMVAAIYRNGEMFIPTGADQLLLNDEAYFVISNDEVQMLLEQFNKDHEAGRRVLIIGGGNIGSTVAQEVERTLKGVSLKIIEKDLEQAARLAQQLKRTEIICGDGLDVEILREASVQDTQTVVAVTEDDKVNILSSLLVKREGGKRALTLLNNMGYSSLISSLGIDAIVSPNAITVSSILRHVRQGGVRIVHSLWNGEVEVIEAEMTESAPMIAMTIEDITIKSQIHVAAIRRRDKIYLGPEKMTISPGDRVVLVVTEEAVPKAERLFI